VSQIFTVAELNSRIRERLSGDPRLRDLWARGELSNVVNHRSGHSYFTLKDRDSQLSCVLFRSYALSLGFRLRDGQNVLVYGDVDVYRPRGQVQLVARGIKVDDGIGLRQRELELLKARLAEEGLFAAERKRRLPPYPERIGIVTSPDGAALRDVLKILGPYPARIILSPALVQGDLAANSVARALESLQGLTDVVIVCRGGGSVEDLWPFNSEVVARAIFRCDSPVVSAIGHETDVTIADFVADVRAPTPTAAAELVVPDLEALFGELHNVERRLVRSLETCLDRPRTRLSYLERTLTGRKMQSLALESRQRIDYLSESLACAEQELIEDKRRRVCVAEGQLSSVSPLATLSRGYALVRAADGSLLTRAEEARTGDRVSVVMAGGRLGCRVEDQELL